MLVFVMMRALAQPTPSLRSVLARFARRQSYANQPSSGKSRQDSRRRLDKQANSPARPSAKVPTLLLVIWPHCADTAMPYKVRLADLQRTEDGSRPSAQGTGVYTVDCCIPGCALDHLCKARLRLLAALSKVHPFVVCFAVERF